MIEYVLIAWPDSLDMLKMPWANECILMADPKLFPEYGKDAYFVPTNRYQEYLDHLNSLLHKL